MAKYSGSWQTITATAINDTAALTDSNYPYALQGGTATQRNNIKEIFVGGEGTTSTPVALVFARDSTASATLVGTGTTGAGARVPALLDGSGTAPATAPKGGNSAATDPQRDTAGHLLHFSFNAFGGIVRWVAADGYEISMVGNAASLGDCSLSGVATTGAAATSGHILFETV